jgi:hypothetical protein
MCLRRAPEKYITGAALDRAGLDIVSVVKETESPRLFDNGPSLDKQRGNS